MRHRNTISRGALAPADGKLRLGRAGGDPTPMASAIFDYLIDRCTFFAIDCFVYL
jgi:hypothetical protein